MEPVTLPPGRARLWTRPVATASPLMAMTMGMVVVAALAARAPGAPCVRMRSTFRRTNSAASAGQTIVVVLGPADLDDDRLAFDVAALA